MGIKKGGFKDITGQKFGRLTALHKLNWDIEKALELTKGAVLIECRHIT